MRTKLAVWSAMVLAGLALAGCDKGNERQLQGWVEAELIFVSPDEQGRVENLKVREGDQVKRAICCSASMTICKRPTWW